MNTDTLDHLIKVDICCGDHKPAGFIGVDIVPGAGVDVVWDLCKNFPFTDNSVDHLRAHDAIEHLPDKIKTMNEIFRVCKPDATVDIKVPSTDGRGAFQDPTHVSYWNINSFLYYSSGSPHYALCRRYGFNGNFKILNIQNISAFDGVIWTLAKLQVVKIA